VYICARLCIYICARANFIDILKVNASTLFVIRTKYIENMIYVLLFFFLYYRYHRYNVQWYVAPLHIQRIILFLLQRGAKNFTLSVGGLFIASLECFASVRK